jgi:uncharacterized protein YjiS (DUF1127 family)
MTATWRIPERGAEPLTAIGLGTITSRIKAVALDIHVRMGALRARRRMRRALSQLDDRLLRDVGLSRADVGHDAEDLRGVADVLALLTDLRPH